MHDACSTHRNSVRPQSHRGAQAHRIGSLLPHYRRSPANISAVSWPESLSGPRKIGKTKPQEGHEQMMPVVSMSSSILTGMVSAIARATTAAHFGQVAMFASIGCLAMSMVGRAGGKSPVGSGLIPINSMRRHGGQERTLSPPGPAIAIEVSSVAAGPNNPKTRRQTMRTLEQHSCPNYPIRITDRQTATLQQVAAQKVLRIPSRFGENSSTSLPRCFTRENPRTDFTCSRASPSARVPIGSPASAGRPCGRSLSFSPLSRAGSVNFSPQPGCWSVQVQGSTPCMTMVGWSRRARCSHAPCGAMRPAPWRGRQSMPSVTDDRVRDYSTLLNQS